MQTTFRLAALDGPRATAITAGVALALMGGLVALGARSHVVEISALGVLVALTGIRWGAYRDGPRALGLACRPTDDLTRRELLALRIGAVAGAGFLLLLLVVTSTGFQSWEREITQGWALAHGMDPAGSAWHRISATAGRDLSRLWLPAIVVLLLALRRGHALRFLLFSSLGILATEGVFKYLIHRSRPETVLRDTFDSFPSGHSLGATVVGLCLLAVLLPTIANRWGRGMLVSVVGIWIVAVACSRVIVGAHFPSDVVAGVLLGFAWTSLCVYVLLRWSPTPPMG